MSKQETKYILLTPIYSFRQVIENPDNWEQFDSIEALEHSLGVSNEDCILKLTRITELSIERPMKS